MTSTSSKKADDRGRAVDGGARTIR